MIQAPKTKPIVFIALKFCVQRTLKLSLCNVDFSPANILLNCFVADLKIEI